MNYIKEINKEYEDWLAKMRDKYLKEMLDNWAEEWALFARPSEVMIEIEYLLDNKYKKYLQNNYNKTKNLIKNSLKQNKIKFKKWKFDILYWTILLKQKLDIKINSEKEFINKIFGILGNNSVKFIEFEEYEDTYEITTFDENHNNKFLIIFERRQYFK